MQTTLGTAADQIRQLAFDGDGETYFASKDNLKADDHFTLLFDEPVAVKSIAATTGRPGASDALDKGELQVSEDGRTFEQIATFAAGAAQGNTNGRKVKALRIQPTADQEHALAIREITIDSEPQVAIFKYPVEFVIDVKEASLGG